MDPLNFSSSFSEIDRAFANTKLNLKYKHDFPPVIRREFNQALDGLFEILQNDKWIDPSIQPWHIASRIVHLNKLKIKLQKIRRRINELPIPPYFIKKINNGTLPALHRRVNDLKNTIEFRERLPFSKGINREEFLKKTKQELQVENIANISHFQNEYFHLLGNHFDAHQLKDVDFKSLCGSTEIRSLISWEQVLHLFVKEGDVDEKQLGATLLTLIQRAIPYALKTSFVCEFKEKSAGLEHFQEMAYFEDYVKAHQTTQSSSFTKKQFLDKYRLGFNSLIPERAIINEMAWDMVDNISALKQWEKRFFLLGTRKHSIAIQVICTGEHALSILDSTCIFKVFEYQIFNTGNGVDYHHMDLANRFARPMIYRDVSSTAFSYSFCSNLLRLSLQNPNIHDFYHLHDQVLVKEAGGKKDLISGAFYPLQKYGICSYTSVEALIDSYLSEKQIKHLEIIKAKFSTNKQEKVVKILGCEKILGKRKNRPDYLEDQRPTKYNKVTESEVLLELGQKFLQDSIQKYNKLEDNGKMDFD